VIGESSKDLAGSAASVPRSSVGEPSENVTLVEKSVGSARGPMSPMRPGEDTSQRSFKPAVQGPVPNAPHPAEANSEPKGTEHKSSGEKLTRQAFDRELRKLQRELVIMQEYVKAKGLKVVVIFRDVTLPARVE